MDEREGEAIRKVVKEMRDAHKVISFWIKGTPIDVTLRSWIEELEKLVK